MEPFDRSIPATVHGHYYVRPAWEATGSAPLLVGFHGYAQNGEELLGSLEGIPGVGGWHLVSVQALHPFYTRDGRVVAAWMTRFDREHAIADNVAYVRAVVEALTEELPTAPILAFAGFSQGVAMAYRAAAGMQCSGVLCLGGDVPPEVEPADLPPVLLGRGRDDERYPGDRLADDLRRLKAGGAPVEACIFDGGHEWSGDFYRAAERFLEGLTTRTPG